MTSRNGIVCFLALLALMAVPGCQSRTPHAPAFPPPSGSIDTAPLPPPSPVAGSIRSATDAAVDLGGSITLAQMLHLAAERNPRLAAARSRWLAARCRPTQARSLPDPMLTYTEMFEPIQTRVGPLERSLQLMQPIPFPGRLSAAGAVATEQARVKELEYHIALRDTVAEVKVSYLELVYLHRAIAIVKQNQALAAQIAEKAAAEYAAQGEPDEDVLNLFDTLKAQQSLAQLEYDAMTLTELLRTEEAKLNSLLSLAANAPIGQPRSVVFRPLGATEEELFQLATARRQEIQSAIHRVKAARYGERLARLSLVPDFSVGVQYSFIGDAAAPVSGSGDDAIGLGLGMSLPIWMGKNRARIAEAQQLARAARFEQQAETDDVMARISKVFFRLENAERLVTLYSTLVPQAENAMRIAEQWHDTGRDTFGRLLEARSVWLNFQLAMQRALVDHEQMIARLEQLVGISLEHLRAEAPQ